MDAELYRRLATLDRARERRMKAAAAFRVATLSTRNVLFMDVKRADAEMETAIVWLLSWFRVEAPNWIPDGVEPYVREGDGVDHG